MEVEGVTKAEVAALLRRTEEATAAFLRGDMARYVELTPHVRGFTLFNPFGGEAARYEDRRPSLMAAAGYFQGGSVAIDLVEVYASGDLLVLVMIERQRARVGGLAEQEWSLRVTQVYRREDGEWRVAHRHADPLTRNVGLERAAELARG